MYEVVRETTPFGKTDDVLKIENTSSSKISYTFGNILEIDNEYTFSCWMKSDTSSATNICISDEFGSFDLTTTWQRIIFTATSNIATSKSVEFTIPAGATLYAYEGQLEVGNKPSDFSANPNDIVDVVNDVDNRVVILQTNFTVQQGQIEQLIKETTIDGKSLSDKFTEITTTVDGTKTDISNIKTDIDGMSAKMTSIEETANGVKTTVTSNQAKWDSAASVAETAQSIANQTADKFSWIVNSGTSATNFTLTDRTAELVAENINLNGLVKITGLDSSTQSKINLPNDTITKWSADTIDENVTIINGGYIRAGTIDLKHLNVDDIFSTGNAVMNIINSQEINASRITSGTIMANRLSLYSLEVRQKDTNLTTLNITDNGDVTMRGSVESYNYISGKAGWSIRNDGDAEFNEVTVRGNVITNDGGIASSSGVISDDKIKEVRFWAGSSYEERDSAPWIVYNDGAMVARNGTFSGVFTGDIKIGNISITDPSSASGGDALLTVQNGQNGVKVVQIRDSESSDFAQEIHIVDNFYNKKISLQQDGVGLFSSGIAIGTNTNLNSTRLIVNNYELGTDDSGYIFKSPQVSVGTSRQDSSLAVYGNTYLNGSLKIENVINFNDVVECTVTKNGIDFNFKD
jgi:hypothetical protein